MEKRKKNNYIIYIISDIPAFAVVHKSNGTKMDSENFVYSTDIRNLFVDIVVIF